MPRWLPILVAQVPARDPRTATVELGDEVSELLRDFPETTLFLYPEYHTCEVSGGPEERADQYAQMAEPLDGPRATQLADIARENKIWLFPGTIIEAGPAGEIFNTAILISPEGEITARYRKIFPWRPFEPFTSGTEMVVGQIPDTGSIGLSICYDIWFPEVPRHLAWLGADVILCPAQTSTSDREQELVLARASAIQNQTYVVSINASAPHGTGRSIIVDPEGVVRSQAPSEAPAFLTDVLDLDAVSRVRKHGTAGLNRMWDQVRSDDAEIPLPLYDGSIVADRWRPHSS